MRWKAVPVEPQSFAGNPARVRVTLTAGTQLELRDPVISHDSLVAPGHPGIPLQRIRWVELRRVDGAATAALVFFAVGPVILIAITSGSGGS
jgi:hypothetical protein